jgi:outer membrane murein-binding lipoprotein Lpp
VRALSRCVVAWALFSVILLAGCGATTAATKPAATIKSLAARLTADEKALKAVQSTQQNQLCSILQLHDEVSQLIAEVAALEAHKPKPAPAAAATVC